MKIIANSDENVKIKVLKVKKATYIGDFVLKILFNTKEDRFVDFKPFLSRSHNPAINKYLDENIFKSFRIENGNLNWNDYDLTFPVKDLYENSILKS